MGLTLVTGATGYLGSHLIDSLLADGVPLRALVYSDWKGEELEERGVEVVYGDVTQAESLSDSALCDGVEAVYHLVGGGNAGRVDPFLINTEGTRNMLAACQPAGLRAFVYVSSSTLYDRQPDWVDEDSETSPRYDYPQSKLDAEELLLEAHRQNGFPAMIARMAGIYGPGAPMLGTDLVRRGRLRITGDGQNVVSIIHVEDAVQALRAMVVCGQPGRVYCLGDNEPQPIHTFHSHFAELIGAPPVRTSSVRRVRNIIRLLGFLSRLTGRKPILTEAVIGMATLNVKMRNRRMREELGVELHYPTYREGLAHCAAWALAEEEE
jgi:nucleoside-diphosphate-sugar epimerase